MFLRCDKNISESESFFLDRQSKPAHYDNAPKSALWQSINGKFGFLNKNIRTEPKAGPGAVLTKYTVKPDTKRLHQKLQP